MIPDQATVVKLYIGNKMPISVVAKELCSNTGTIHNILKRVGVVRSYSEARKLAFREGRSWPIEALRAYRETHKSSKHPSWKGGHYKTEFGYIKVLQSDHPYADSRGRIFEHRLVMEQKLNRYLLPSEKVHHINGIKDDNRTENLKLLSPADHNIRNQLCSRCELRKEIRLFQWQIRELTTQLQGKII